MFASVIVRQRNGAIFETGRLPFMQALIVAQSFALAEYGVTLRRA